MEALEEQLIMADLGLEATHRVLELLRQRLDREHWGQKNGDVRAQETLTELLAEQQSHRISRASTIRNLGRRGKRRRQDHHHR